VAKRIGREENPKQRREGMRDSYQRKMKEIFIAREASYCYSNGHHFDSRAPTQVRHFENHALCAGYPNGQVNYSTFQRKVHKDVTIVQLSTRVFQTHQCVSNISST
jgi:hypothetical protein